MTEFVDGWNIVGVLGEGAFGDVKLLECPDQGSFVAMKCVDMGRHPGAAADVRKEIAVHRLLDHRNVLKYIGHRTVGPVDYIFLEYAPNGELFDRIEPDIGMAVPMARRLFGELLCGLEYLHGRGIAHRDIKPENLLLGVGDTLKISDFGLATVFRHHGRERLLDRACGTLPYAAPEVLSGGPYRGDHADLWSAGIVLVAMLTGELPWDKADVETSPEFAAWTGLDTGRLPPLLCRLEPDALCLVRAMLCAKPEARLKLQAVLSSRWMRVKDLSVLNVAVGTDCDDLDGDDMKDRIKRPRRLTCSQPVADVALLQSPVRALLPCSTQPNSNLLLDSQQCLATQQSSAPLHLILRRMTRFVVPCDVDETLSLLERVAAAQGMIAHRLSMTNVANASNTVPMPPSATVVGRDRRNARLELRVTVLAQENEADQTELRGKQDEDEDVEKENRSRSSNTKARCLLDFRLSRGDGLEFKRTFLRLKEGFAKLAAPIRSAVAWPS
ncbi:unnamed protein product [Notodromas monacha]|uniref:non-specific serine/threonine protein kinase n=1 Tax=Notodromas monacha TaxID=399045 RepID=A0A7R9GI09_9CRUS|nr:unnamed protein product [Notodromas monacha]CAG0923364.1 unnamed protein product [Notodromas monacha]